MINILDKTETEMKIKYLTKISTSVRYFNNSFLEINSLVLFKLITIYFIIYNLS